MEKVKIRIRRPVLQFNLLELCPVQNRALFENLVRFFESLDRFELTVSDPRHHSIPGPFEVF